MKTELDGANTFFEMEVCVMKGKKKPAPMHPERVLQFGDGVFLRGFVDWMLHHMNEQGLFRGQAVVVQPFAEGSADEINEQNGMYTLLHRGICDGRTVDEAELIGSIRRAINPYSDYKAFLHCALNPDLRFIVSDTSPEGIVFTEDDHFTDFPPSSFPAKLTVFLYKRFKTYHGKASKTFVILPCEQIDRNGDVLKQTVLRYARKWHLEQEFVWWIGHNEFVNTVADRLVTGYPQDEIKELTHRIGYVDHLINTAEPFHQWIIETANPRLPAELPLAQAGLNAVWTNQLTPYHTRKVRILDGMQTILTLTAFLCGKQTMKQGMDDSLLAAFVHKVLSEEIIPSLDPELAASEATKAYADLVPERLANPLLQRQLHRLVNHAVAQFRRSVLPSLLEFRKRHQYPPALLCFSLAALILLYKGTALDNERLAARRATEVFIVEEETDHVATFRDFWSAYEGTPASACQLVSRVLKHEPFWGMSLANTDGLAAQISTSLVLMINKGIPEALWLALQGKPAIAEA
ncbi:tagaturonate reductase [Paenibacillus sp. NPDC056579]|uniref:tagaturonate reductase n=1 Tax=Paenibacillus sp. NPDC056579 TaxID=3345871 RepID=UPI00368089DC